MSSNFTFTHTEQQHVRRKRLTTNDSVSACVRCIVNRNVYCENDRNWRH